MACFFDERLLLIYERVSTILDQLSIIFERVLHIMDQLSTIFERLRPIYERVSVFNERLLPIYDQVHVIDERLPAKPERVQKLTFHHLVIITNKKASLLKGSFRMSMTISLGRSSNNNLDQFFPGR